MSNRRSLCSGSPGQPGAKLRGLFPRAFDDMKAAHAHVATEHKKGNAVMTVRGCDPTTVLACDHGGFCDNAGLQEIIRVAEIRSETKHRHAGWPCN